MKMNDQIVSFHPLKIDHIIANASHHIILTHTFCGREKGIVKPL